MSNIYKKLSVGNLMAMAVILPMVANTTNTASSPLLPSAPDAQKAAQAVKAGDVQILRINPTLVEIVFANQQRVAVDFYGESVFRVFEDHNDGVMRAPEAKPEASILVDNPRTALNHKQVKVEENDNSIILSTTKAQVIFDKATQLFRIINLEHGKTVAEQSDPAQFTPEKVTLSLREKPLPVLSTCGNRPIHQARHAAGMVPAKRWIRSRIWSGDYPGRQHPEPEGIR